MFHIHGVCFQMLHVTKSKYLFPLCEKGDESDVGDGCDESDLGGGYNGEDGDEDDGNDVVMR